MYLFMYFPKRIQWLPLTQFDYMYVDCVGAKRDTRWIIDDNVHIYTISKHTGDSQDVFIPFCRVVTRLSNEQTAHKADVVMHTEAGHEGIIYTNENTKTIAGRQRNDSIQGTRNTA